jgi:hypothetical protein
MEGKEWVLINGVWTEQQFSEAREAIKKASKREIEEVSLRIWESLVKKL